MNTNTSEGNLAVPDNTVIVAKSGAGDPDYTNTAANSTLRSDAISVGNTGNNQPHTNIQPFQCVNFVIALVGLFPSRN